MTFYEVNGHLCPSACSGCREQVFVSVVSLHKGAVGCGRARWGPAGAPLPRSDSRWSERLFSVTLNLADKPQVENIRHSLFFFHTVFFFFPWRHDNCMVKGMQHNYAFCVSHFGLENWKVWYLSMILNIWHNHNCNLHKSGQRCFFA